MSEITVSNRRTTSDLVVGGLVVVLGLIILGNTAFAAQVSIIFVGWLLFAGGVLTLAASLFSIGKEGFWVGAVGGGLMTVLGLVCLRHTNAAAVTLMLVAGAMFLTTGLARLVAAFQVPVARIPLLISGAVSTLLGLIVLFNVFSSSFTLLGIILGVQTLAEGLAIMVVGRTTLTVTGPGGASTSEAPASSA